MRTRRTKLLLFLAFAGSVLAGVFPIGLSVRELSNLSTSVLQINEAASVTRQARDVGEKVGLAVTDFTAIALDLDPIERKNILSETDKHVSSFAQSVAGLKKSIKHWLSEQQDRDLSEATEALAHSWEEIRDHSHTQMSSGEKVYHFLQMADNAKKARGVLRAIEVHTSSLTDTETRLAFERLRSTGTFLVTAIAVGFLINSFGSVRIFRSLKSTWKQTPSSNAQS